MRVAGAGVLALVWFLGAAGCVGQDDEADVEKVHVVESNETVWSIARDYGVTVDELMEANPDFDDPGELRVGQRLRIPTDGRDREGEEEVHVVRQGETLWSIAQQYGVTVDEVMEANPEVSHPADIRVGQRITVPSETPPADGLPPVTRVEGRMTGEGVTCPAMRSEDGTLYTLAGDAEELDALEPGDPIYVEGTRPEVSICQQGITLEVTHLERR